MADLPYRILHIVGGMNRGGAETVIMNIYRNIDRNRVQFDFVSHNPEECHYDSEIKALGGRIFYMPSLGQSGPVRYTRQLGRLIKDNGPFAAMHAHMDYQTGFPAFAARLAGVRIRICHSHSTAWKMEMNLVDALMLNIFRWLIRHNATEYCACSRNAALFLFGRKLVERKKVKIINNCVDVSFIRSIFDMEKTELRSQMNIPRSKLVIGHVGRFFEEKNHIFILHLAEHMKSMGIDFTFLLIGDGPLRSEMEKKADEMDLTDAVRFLGVRSEILQLMTAMDVFILPSLYEGLPVVLIEAQATGTRCVVSDTVTREADVGLGLIRFIGLNETMDGWIGAIEQAASEVRPAWTDVDKYLSAKGFNIRNNLGSIYSVYGLEALPIDTV